MPVTLTPDGSAFVSVTAPAGGDPRTAASVATGLQGCANREEWLHGRRVDRVASTAALAAVTGAADGDVALVYGGKLFQYVTGATAPANTALGFTSTGTPGGCWLLVREPNLLTHVNETHLAHDFINSSSSFADALTITHADASIGDVITVRWGGECSTAGSGSGVVRIVAVEGSTTTVLAEHSVSGAWEAATLTKPFAGCARYTVTATESVAIKMQTRKTAGSNIALYSDADEGSSTTMMTEHVIP